MKKLFIRMLVTAMLSVSACVSWAGVIDSGNCGAEGDNLTWSLSDDYVLTISGSGEMEDFYKYKHYSCEDSQHPYEYYYTIPWYDYLKNIKSLELSGMKSIGEMAFYDCSSLTSVTIPNSVTSIGEEAFSGCSSLVSVTIPSSVTSIGSSAFYGCSSLPVINGFRYADTYLVGALNKENLTSVNIPEKTRFIGSAVFSGCSSLTSVTIPNNVTSIGDRAFSGCSSLTSVTIPNSVTSIGSSAFSGCSSLVSVTIPSSVTSIGYSAFYGCSSLPVINGFRYADTYLIGVEDKENLTSVNIPEKTRFIGSSAFSGCSSLTSVTIPNNVTSIGDLAFSHCSSLTSVTIPSGVTSIGEMAFYDCSSLTGAVIPNSVTSLGGYAFEGCKSLTSIVLPNSISYISGCFSCCESLKTITLLGVTEIYNHSINNANFYRCNSLETIRIPNVKYLVSWHYHYYGVGEREVGLKNFSGCSLSAVYLGSVPIEVDDHEKQEYSDRPPLKSDGILYVPIGCKATYVANGWGEYNIEEYDINDPYAMYENAIYVKDDVVRTGTTATLPIYMKNKEAATGYEFSIILPQGINASDVVLKKSTARKADEVSFSSALQADGTIKVICYSTDGQPFAGNDGEIATLTMPIPDDLKAGDYPLLIDKIEITNNGKATVVYDQLYTNLTVKDYFLGDANCDKRVSVSDLSIIVNHILNVNIDPEAPYNALAADANEDERISVSDLSAIVNIILYGNPDGPSEGKARDEMDAQSFLFSAPAFTINPGEESTLYLQLANSMDVTAFQFDAILPEGLTCIQTKRVAARVGEEHSFQSSLMDEQTRRMVCYSSTNANIEGNEGAIVELTIKAADNLLPGLYTLSLEGLEVVSHNQGMTLDNVALSIEVVDADGIEELQQDQTAKTRYDLMGRSTIRPQHGIYFENGRKVLVK